MTAGGKFSGRAVQRSLLGLLHVGAAGLVVQFSHPPSSASIPPASRGHHDTPQSTMAAPAVPHTSSPTAGTAPPEATITPTTRQAADTSWIARVEESIRTQEYAITWQEQTSDGGPPAANRAANLRAYSREDGTAIMARTTQTGFAGHPLNDVTPPSATIRLSHFGGRALPPPERTILEDDDLRQHMESVELSIENSESGLRQTFTLDRGDHGREQVHLRFTSADGVFRRIPNSPAVRIENASGAAVATLNSMEAVDRDGRRLETEMSLDSGVISVFVEARDAQWPIQVTKTLVGFGYPWTYESNQVSGSLGQSVENACDVNGDGFDDIIVGANYGEARLYLGSSGWVQNSHAWDSNVFSNLYGVVPVRVM